MRGHRIINRTIWVNSFSENIMLNLSDNAKKKHTLPETMEIVPNLKQGLFPRSFHLFFSHFLETRIFPDKSL